MTSFQGLSHYNSLTVLAAGFATLVGFWGTGFVALGLSRVSLPNPWRLVTSLLLGILVQSLIVQLLGTQNLTSPAALRTVWWVFAVLGVSVAFVQLVQRRHPLKWTAPCSGWLAIVLLCVVGLALVTDLLIAAAPSTKIDELYYHMLTPSRIVSDGGLRFYREPWQGAIWPQMIYQISAAPLHALGLPDVMNVVSWGLSAAGLWFAWQIIRERSGSEVWASIWSAALAVGLYPAVWQVTGGAHAFGDLALMAAIMAYCDRETLRRAAPATSYTLMLSIFLLAAAASKISLLPGSLAVLVFAFVDIVRSNKSSAFKTAWVMVLPWVIFVGPIGLWAWAQSGSPFGPVHPWPFESTIYDYGWSKATFEYTRSANQGSLRDTLQHAAVDYSPLIWLGVLGALATSSLAMKDRVILGALFVVQGLLIVLVLPWDVRFLGGLHYGILVAFAAYAKPTIRKRLEDLPYRGGVLAAFLLPWLGVQMYYASQFIPVVLGADKSAFYRRYVALSDDYLKLDQLLPQDAVILVQNLRLGSVYAPRPVFFDLRDVPTNKPTFLFTSPEMLGMMKPLVQGFVVGDVVYQNNAASIITYRTPGREPVRRTLEVSRLARQQTSPSKP